MVWIHSTGYNVDKKENWEEINVLQPLQYVEQYYFGGVPRCRIWVPKMDLK
jgi:hypothetical protein